MLSATAPAEEAPLPTPTVASAAAPAVVDEAIEAHRAQPAPTAQGLDTTAAPPHRFDLHVYWERGLNYVLLQPIRIGSGEYAWLNQDITLTGRIGVRLGVDVAGYLEHGSLPPLGTEFNLRRLLFYTTGEFRFVIPVLFKIDLGLIENGFYFSDAYVWMQDVPYVGTVKLGQFDAPMSLEALTGSTYETFMEYGSPVEALAPGLKVGLQIADHRRDGRATWAFGYFTDGQTVDVGDASVSIARLMGRLTWLPVAPESDGDLLIHLGASANYVLSSHDRIRYRSRPESFLAPDLVDTGDLDTNDAFPFGLEFAAKQGPLTVQAEYLGSPVDAGSLGHPYFDGAYASVSWFLTGEHRSYNTSEGKIGPLVPYHDVSWRQAHWGAWELAARFSWLDLSDADVRGGRMAIITGGVNWYWNRYIRLMFNTNLVRTDNGPTDGRLAILQARFQLAF